MFPICEVKIGGERKVRTTLAAHSDAKAPYFIEKPENKIVKEGTNDFLEAVVDGHPFPNITWYKGARELAENSKFGFQVDKSTGIVGLSITRAKAEDEAKYTLRIHNDLGEEKATCSLFVKCKRLRAMMMIMMMITITMIDVVCLRMNLFIFIFRIYIFVAAAAKDDGADFRSLLKHKEHDKKKSEGDLGDRGDLKHGLCSSTYLLLL